VTAVNASNNVESVAEALPWCWFRQWLIQRYMGYRIGWPEEYESEIWDTKHGIASEGLLVILLSSHLQYRSSTNGVGMGFYQRQSMFSAGGFSMCVGSA
jgi:hypothetical protein